jgi:hypothetical protein
MEKYKLLINRNKIAQSFHGDALATLLGCAVNYYLILSYGTLWQ